MSGGTLTSQGNGHYIAVPSAVGQDVTFTVTGTDKGTSRTMGSATFHVRKLPDPTAYIAMGTDRFKGGRLQKASLMSVNNLRAAIDDGLLDIEFKVLSFETVFYDNMGNAVPMASALLYHQRDSFRTRRHHQKIAAGHGSHRELKTIVEQKFSENETHIDLIARGLHGAGRYGAASGTTQPTGTTSTEVERQQYHDKGKNRIPYFRNHVGRCGVAT